MLKAARLSAALTLALWTAASVANAVGPRYGAREPHPCPPTQGVRTMTQALAAVLVVCAEERESMDDLYLVGGVTVEVGVSRPFQASDSTIDDIDVRAPVFPIRGRLVRHQCKPVDPGNRGKNCNVYLSPNASSMCYRNTFGSWWCDMIDSRASATPYRYDLPPPG